MIRIDVKSILLSALSSAKEQIQRNLADTGTNASGKTSQSLAVAVTDTSGELSGRFAFGTVETGRKGGKVPSGFRDIIYQWMQDKGVHAEAQGRRSQESADRSMAYLIARKIAREGSKLYREGGRKDIYSNVLPITIERVSTELTNEYIININSIIDDNLNQ